MKLITISLSPNTEKDDILLAAKLIFKPWLWIKGNAIEKLEKEFKEYLGIKFAFSFNSGRSSLIAVLNALGLEKGDEVLLQAFTCNAVVNPILWQDLRPVFVDCNENDFNIDFADLKRKISPKAKALIIQHTFGIPADIDEIIKFCKENKLILIEDCAHSLGSTHKSKKIGTFGDISFFSFSRDKVISSVYGGMVATNNVDLAQKVKDFQEKIKKPFCFWVLQQLLHPVLMNWLILPTYKIFGKYLLIMFQWTHVLSKAVHWKEKRGLKPAYFPKRMSNALAILALNQLKKLERFNLHRKEIADFYYNELKNTKFILPEISKDKNQNFLRFVVRHPKAHEIINKAFSKNILIGDWYTTPIAPHDTKLYKMQYLPGSCPIAEKLAKEIINLPTHINTSLKDAQKVIEFLKQWK